MSVRYRSAIGGPVSDTGVDSFWVAHGNDAANGQMMSGLSSTRFTDATDGLSKTALLPERAWNNVSSSRPFTSVWIGIVATASQNVFDSFPFIEMTENRPINSVGGTECFSSYHSGGAHLALGDGSVWFFSENMDGKLFESLGTIAGGEVK